VLHCVLEFIVRASLIAAATAIVLWIMHIKTPAPQHRAWTGVLLVMFALPVWDAWGPRAQIRILPRIVESTTRKATAPPTRGLAMIPRRTVQKASQMGYLPFHRWDWQALLLCSYSTGLCVLLIRLALGTIGANRLAREAIERNGKLTHEACAAPITVGWFHPTVILPGSWLSWPERQIDAVMTHEREHARRRDPLIHWLALLGRALFWFHPLAWWLERRLSNLAEQACDAKVLARGYSPFEYADYLLEMSRSVMQASTRISIAGLMMPGTFLQHRLKRILSGAVQSQPSQFRLVCTGIAWALAFGILAAGNLEHTGLATTPEHPTIYRQSNWAGDDFPQVKGRQPHVPKRLIARSSFNAETINAAPTKESQPVSTELGRGDHLALRETDADQSDAARSSEVQLPNTPAGQVLRAWLAMFDSNDDDRTQAFILKFAPKQSPAMLMQFRTDTGPLSLLSIIRSDRVHIEFHVKQTATSKTATGDLEVTDTVPPQIVSMNFRGLQVLSHANN
jgi:BlaR1 peptidase M56